MPHSFSASHEAEHPLSVANYQFDIPRSLSVPPHSASASPLPQQKKSCKVVDLTKPYFDAFPSPPNSLDGSTTSLTPAVQASKALDAFPFPFNSGPVATPGTLSRCRNIRNRKAVCNNRISDPQFRSPSSSPDRFIPNRRSPESSSKSFRLSKLPKVLSDIEGVERTPSASIDPFGPRSPRQIRQASRLDSTVSESQPSRTRSGTTRDSAILAFQRASTNSPHRNVSAGAVWRVGGVIPPLPRPVEPVVDGRGGLSGSGTNAPMYTSRFFETETADQTLERFEGRLALALDIDQASRTLSISRSPPRDRNATTPSSDRKRARSKDEPRPVWRDGAWVHDDGRSLLDAPSLRDDYYCSILAYCHTSRTLAVGLGNRVYLWCEGEGVKYPRADEERDNTYVTSLSFSSTQGGHSILAMGRNNGQISLWSLFDDGDRFQSQQPNAVACVCFKPVPTRKSPDSVGEICTEELLVGDEVGNVYYYSVQWVENSDIESYGSHGTMSLIAKITVHSQQICGIAWSPDGAYFATGGNDNACCLFEVRDIFKQQNTPQPRVPLQTLMASFGPPTFVPNATNHQTLRSMIARSPRDGYRNFDAPESATLKSSPNLMQSLRPMSSQNRSTLVYITDGQQKHRWAHSAAVKAIAFCPWQRGLLATGGGSNDRAIHFFHTFSGACLATIDVQAQVTSLIWSTTRREIVATFGYAQPEHPYRIAVFSWPDCRQVVAIPWASEMRALYAIAYPGGPNDVSRLTGEGGIWWSRTAEEGCIVVASSDESVKFHEVWKEARKSTGSSPGLLGGSDILESLEGIDKEGSEVIR